LLVVAGRCHKLSQTLLDGLDARGFSGPLHTLACGRRIAWTC